MTAPGRKGFGKQLGIVAAVFACSPGPSCADQDTFFPVGERTFLLPCRNASGGSASRRPPKARLRIRRCACICHRQRIAPDSRKATRGSVLWTPRKGGESKGVTRVAARAVRRGLIPRIPLTLNRTSDRDFAPPQPAARRNTNSKINTRHCEPVRRLVWQSAFRADNIRPYRCNPGSSSQAAPRTAWRPGMDLVPDVHSVRYPRKRSHALQNVARVWRPFLFGVQEPFLFSRKIEKRNGSCFTQVKLCEQPNANERQKAPRGCGALCALRYTCLPWARSISSLRAMSFGDRST